MNRQSDSQTLPFITYLLMGLCGLMFAEQLSTATQQSLGYPLYVSGLAFWNGKYWGLLTSFFMHVTFLHIAMNLYWLRRLGVDVEKAIGWYWYLLFWIVATAASSLAEISFMGELGTGASGFVYGLFGFRLVGARSRPQLQLTPDTILTFVSWFFICIFLTYSGTLAIANAAHGGGFLMGCLLAYGFLCRKEPWAKIATTGLVMLLAIPCFYAPWTSSWNLAKAGKAYEQNNYQQALAYLSNINVPYYRSYVLEVRANCYLDLKQESAAIENYKIMMSEGPEDVPNRAFHLNNYAWLLLTCQDKSLRDPVKAIEYAELACKYSDYKDANSLDTLATAYDTSGNFLKAIDWEQKALDANPAQNDIPSLKEHLKFFKTQAEKAGSQSGT